MSVSSINATKGSSAAAAVLQAQAVQYANHFAALQSAVNSGDLNGARKALSIFQQDSSAASSKGIDPLSQSGFLREAFSSVKKALAGGDIATAKTAMASTVQALSTAQAALGTLKPSTDGLVKNSTQSIEPNALTEDSSGVVSSEKLTVSDLASQSNIASPSANLSVKFVPDARSLQVMLKSGDPKKVSSTFVKIQPELSSFKQGTQVFPTAGMAAYTLPPTVTNSRQAVLQGMQSVFDSKGEGSSSAVSAVKL